MANSSPIEPESDAQTHHDEEDVKDPLRDEKSPAEGDTERDLEAQTRTKPAMEDEEDERTVQGQGPTPDAEKGDVSTAADDDAQWEVKWDEIDTAHPHQWSPRYRWILTFLGGFAVLNVTFSSSAPSENIEQLMRHFHYSEEVGILVVALFVAGFCAGPLLWGPGSEIWGRRPMLVIAYILYSCFNLGCALAPNTGALLTFRLLAGAAGSAPVVIAGAIVADMWEPRRRGVAMSVFALTPFAGPALGPVVGGFIATSGTSWRWTFWVLFIYGSIVTLMVALVIPETYAPVLLVWRARQKRKETGEPRWWAEHERKKRTAAQLAHYVVISPFMMLIEEPMLATICVYSSYIFGLVYLSFEGWPYIFTFMHGLNAGKTGLTFLALFVGGLSANLLYIFFIAPRYAKLVPLYAPKHVPAEKRLHPALIGAALYPVSLFWLAWTSWPSVSIWSPIVASVLFGFCTISTLLSLLNYIVDVYLYRAASAIAINLVLRSLAGAGFPLFATQMFNKLGVHWAVSLLAFLALAGAPIPFVLYKYGDKIRQMSKNAPKR